MMLQYCVSRQGIPPSRSIQKQSISSQLAATVTTASSQIDEMKTETTVTTATSCDIQKSTPSHTQSLIITAKANLSSPTSPAKFTNFSLPHSSKASIPRIISAGESLHIKHRGYPTLALFGKLIEKT